MKRIKYMKKIKLNQTNIDLIESMKTKDFIRNQITTFSPWSKEYKLDLEKLVTFLYDNLVEKEDKVKE